MYENHVGLNFEGALAYNLIILFIILMDYMVESGSTRFFRILYEGKERGFKPEMKCLSRSGGSENILEFERVCLVIPLLRRIKTIEPISKVRCCSSGEK